MNTNTQPALQTPEEYLETPQAPEVAKGLVPRAGLWVTLGAFVVALLVFAAWDLSRPPQSPNQAADQKKDAGKTGMAVNKIGTSPPAQDIANMAKAQESKGDQGHAPTTATAASPATNQTANPLENSRDAPLPAASAARRAGIGSVVLAGARDANTSPTYGANMPNMPDASSGQASRDQRDAIGAVSAIIAMTGEGSGTGAPFGSVGQAAAHALGGTLGDPIERQIAELTKAKTAASTATPDTAGDIARIIAAQGQANPKGPAPGKDQAWLKEASAEGTPEATYAKPAAADWMVFQGTRIPVVTREAINSDLPGQITAMSTANIYDGIHQCAVMVPVGTKFIGTYSADIRPGQSRLLLAYKRMIFPDGRSVDLSGAQGVDRVGIAGIEGDVDNHLLKMFGYASGGAQVTTQQSNGTTTTTTIAGQVLADIGSRVMNRNTNIQPTIQLDPGMPMFVTTVRDIALKPTSRARCT